MNEIREREREGERERRANQLVSEQPVFSEQKLHQSCHDASVAQAAGDDQKVHHNVDEQRQGRQPVGVFVQETMDV